MKILKLTLTLAVAITAGCEHPSYYHYFLDMRNSPAIDPQQMDTIGGRPGDRHMPANTVPYSAVGRIGGYRYTVAEIDLAERSVEAPPAAEVDLKRGALKYNIYCLPCHGEQGYGNGQLKKKIATIKALVRKPDSTSVVPAESYKVERIYHIVTMGNGTMGGYGPQINQADRWNISYYVKNVLQKK